MATSSICQEELGILRKLLITVNNLYLYLTGQISTPSFRGNDSGWAYLHVGKSWFYSKTITYTGSASTQDINFPKSIQLNRIEQIWDDDTTRDYSIRVFTIPGAYTELDTQTGNTDNNMVLRLDDKYPSGTRLQFYSGVNTNLKTNTILIQVDEL